jgi:signal transduction histidine kinase/ligand-binding sensor domain-containing protein/DNA-binding response OmpR family regulator
MEFRSIGELYSKTYWRHTPDLFEEEVAALEYHLKTCLFYMGIRKSIRFVIYAMMLTLQVAAQEDIKFTALTTKDGLSSNTINAILKDRLGLIWFATEDGLNKFNGSSFTVYRYKPGDSTSLQSNEILSLHEDNSGNLWIGTSGGSVSLYDRKMDHFINIPSGPFPNQVRHNVIRGITSDYKGNIWIAHYGGINILDPKTRRLTKIPIGSGFTNFIQTKPCLSIFEDSRHRMWIGTEDGLVQYNPVTKLLTKYPYSADDSNSLTGNIVNAIAEDYEGTIWAATNNGLNLLKSAATHFESIGTGTEDLKTLSHSNITSIVAEGETLWLGSGGGLRVLHTKTGRINRYQFDYRNIHGLTSSAVRNVYLDEQGICWLGTTGGGVNKYDKNLNLFDLVQSNRFDEQGLQFPVVCSFAQDQNGDVFVGTEAGGLSLFHPATKLFEHFTILSERKGSNNYITVLALKMTKNRQLLVGTFAEGLFIMDPVSKRYRQILQGSSSLSSNNIFCLMEDSKGNIWVGTNGEGVNVFDKDYKVIARYTPNPKFPGDIKMQMNGFIRDIEEDRKGNIWIATHGGGLVVLQPSTGKFTNYTSYNSKLPNDKVYTLLEDRHGNMWAGTFGSGLAIFNQNNQITTISEKDGLQNNTIYSLEEDQNGLIWVSSNKAISSIEPGTKKIYNYNLHNGVQNNNFVRGASLRLSTGELFFGGREGFNYFNPAYLNKNNTPPTVLITDLRIGNRSVTPSDDGPIKENISIAKKISLAFKQSFTLSFVALNYTSPEQNQYAYKLEGFDKDWNYVGNSNTVSYTNLDPGEYVFRVKASNNDGVWNNEGTSIKLIIRPPFWRTSYAYILYSLLVTGGVLYFRYRSIQKLKREFALQQLKNQAEQQRKEAERIHELDMLKLKFLTNLSHEFRTPISLILGPTDTLLSQQKNKESSGHLHMIKRNAKRLLNLVNQLLDFRKMEEQELELQPSEGDLVSFIKDVCDSFKDLSERKKIQFDFNTDFDSLYTLFDHDKIERILFNVLSNAFKFTLEGGKISLHLEKSEDDGDPSKVWVSMKITDTGIGIPQDKKEKIFERFFQNSTSASILNQGSGIGLSITKEFVKMHGGTIEVESEIEKGTTFKINLPFIPLAAPLVINNAPSSETANEEIELTNTEKTNGLLSGNGISEMPSILLVEDNEDFRFYLKDNLKLHYKVFEASDGKEGWQKTLAHHPQLIVSDISMPNMDGIELTEKIKSDKRTSHIPIILLTALTGEEDQLKGLGTGANDYITKPFNFEVLNAKIKNLLVLNSTLKNVYSKQIKVLTPEVNIESDDERLMNTILIYLEENLTNPELSVEELSRHVGMSRSSLYNKILEITGQTPVEFIRSYKLDKAAVLLEKSDMNIAQIAYSVGFSTPNYFAKSFKTKFNMLPSEYINKMRKNDGNKNAESN